MPAAAHLRTVHKRQRLITDRDWFLNNPGVDIRVRRPLLGEPHPLGGPTGPGWIVVVERWNDSMRSKRFISPECIDPPWSAFVYLQLASGRELVINVETLTWLDGPQTQE